MLATDVYLGAWLLHSGAALKRVLVSRSNGKPTAVFELDGPDIDAHAAAWFSETAVANLAAYRRQVELLKDQLFDALRNASREDTSRHGTENERRTDDDYSRPRRPLARR